MINSICHGDNTWIQHIMQIQKVYGIPLKTYDNNLSIGWILS